MQLVLKCTHRCIQGTRYKNLNWHHWSWCAGLHEEIFCSQWPHSGTNMHANGSGATSMSKSSQSRMCFLLKHHQYSGDRAHCLLSCLSVTLVKALHTMSTVHKETASARFHFVVSQDSVIAHELHFFSNYNAENLPVCHDSNTC